MFYDSFVRRNSSDLVFVRRPNDAVKILARYSKFSAEFLTVTTISENYEVIGSHILAVGASNRAVVNECEILQTVLLDKAKTFILSHNHPDGNMWPSSEDVSLTRKLNEASKILGICFLDHIIVIFCYLLKQVLTNY